MFHIIYQTTCLVNNKIYVGKHSTKNLNDGYLGSGVLLAAAIKKYGKKNFKKEIIQIFDNEDSALLKEQEIVNLDFVLREDTYNVSIGGKAPPRLFGDKNPMFGKNFTEEHRLKISIANKGRKFSKEFSENLSKSRSGENHPMFGKHHSMSTRTKMSNSKIKTYVLINELGDVINVDNIQEFCDSNDISRCTLTTYSKKNKFYKGFKILSSTLIAKS